MAVLKDGTLQLYNYEGDAEQYKRQANAVLTALSTLNLSNAFNPDIGETQESLKTIANELFYACAEGEIFGRLTTSRKITSSVLRLNVSTYIWQQLNKPDSVLFPLKLLLEALGNEHNTQYTQYNFKFFLDMITLNLPEQITPQDLIGHGSQKALEQLYRLHKSKKMGIYPILENRNGQLLIANTLVTEALHHQRMVLGRIAADEALQIRSRKLFFITSD